MMLFCFSFFPGRDTDLEKLPETRLQLAQCDGYMFFTDDKAPLPDSAPDVTRVSVPEQRVDRKRVDRKSEDWLSHRNMAALTPAWVYLLENEVAEKFDWVLNVELDHFTRPSMVRSAIAETLDILRTGSAWERSFFEAEDPAQTKPMMLAFGNAFIFNRASVELMRGQWPLPGMTKDGGCPVWSPKHCEQDMVYPKMMGYFDPPIQMFGPSGCGKVGRSSGDRLLPMGCWEFFQNPKQTGDVQDEAGQLRAVAAIATGLHGGLPSASQGPASPTERRQLNIDDTEGEDFETGKMEDDTEEVVWEKFLPPRNIPILHHVKSSAVLREARLRLGL